jgi:hypothetical protein
VIFYPILEIHMTISRKIFIIGLIFILGLSACNLPSQAPPDPLEEAEIAVTATLLALTANPPLVTDTPVATPLPTETGTITPTDTPSVPMVTVSTNTNCRTGPGVVYDLIGALLVGEKAVVVGKFTSGNYWIINNPDSSGTCWLWGQYATISGNTAGLPEYAAPPTPTPTNTPTPSFTPTPPPPNAPANVSVAKACVPLVLPQYMLTAIISWEDKSTDETGFRVYRNGTLIATLGPNVITHNDSIPVNMGVPLTYGVEAFNATGASSQTTASAVICP